MSDEDYFDRLNGDYKTFGWRPYVIPIAIPYDPIVTNTAWWVRQPDAAQGAILFALSQAGHVVLGADATEAADALSVYNLLLGGALLECRGTSMRVVYVPDVTEDLLGLRRLEPGKRSEVLAAKLMDVRAALALEDSEYPRPSLVTVRGECEWLPSAQGWSLSFWTKDDHPLEPGLWLLFPPHSRGT